MNDLSKVQRGDLVVLVNWEDGLRVSGFVNRYYGDKITLSTRYPYNLSFLEKIVAFAHLSKYSNLNSRPYKFKNHKDTYALKYFDDFEILKSYRNKV